MTSERPTTADAWPGPLHARFQEARRDQALAVLEGFHAIKHALRFGAELLSVAGTEPDELERLAASLAPDLTGRFRELVEVVDPDTFGRFAPRVPRTGVMALARRPRVDVTAVLGDAAPRPIVLLEDPRNLFNIGACVRAAAAADVGGVLTTGAADPWQPDALRGSAGLHFALPVARLADAGTGSGERPLVAVDPEGAPYDPSALPARAVLAFGSERDGLSAALLAAADERIAIPMRAGVSSLNLATSVAAVLYAWRLRA
jgi:RNA methyltransferase, TrmH family